MDIGVPSRFACLKIEDDDFHPGNSQNKKKGDKLPNKKPNSAAKEASKSCWTATRKKGIPNEKSKTAPQPNHKKNHKQGHKPQQDKVWEEWQKKDTVFVNDVFEQQMQNAILQSKLEFEQQKKNAKKEPVQTPGKKKKGKTMSWDQFVENKDSDHEEESKGNENQKAFFDDVVETVKKEITKEAVEEGRKKRQKKFDEVFSLTQLQQKLEEEREKNSALEAQLKEAKKEILLVKQRNTKLCSMLSEGEMKNKVEVISEMQRLTLLKEEMIGNIAQLSRELERERTKSAEMEKQNKIKPGQKIQKKKFK